MVLVGVFSCVVVLFRRPCPRYLGQRTGALPTLSLRSQGVKVELNVTNEEAIRHDINEALVFGAFLE